MTTETTEDLKVRTQLRPGDEAPDFEGRDENGQQFKLSDLREKTNVLLVFYPWAFTRTCEGELCTLRDENADLAERDDVELIGISCDSAPVLRQWKKEQKFVNRFVSDFWPHGDIAKKYGAFDERIGAAVRCTFLIDKQGIVRFAEYTGLEQLAQARDQAAWRAAIEQLDAS